MHISKVIFSVTMITLMARLLSLVSIQVYMSFFGPRDAYINVYSYALNVPNIIFNVIGTFITAIVVPIYVSLKDKPEGAKFMTNMMALVFALIGFLVAMGYLFAPAIVSLTQFQYDQLEFAVVALRVMLMAMFFYGFHYMFQGMLHAHDKFFMPAFVTIPSSLVVIGYVVFLGDRWGVHGLLYATVLGLSMQALVLLPQILRLKIKWQWPQLADPQVKKALILAGPVLVSVLSFQINTFFNATLATRFNLVTIMAYAQNLMLVVILSVVYAITAVYLPKLTQMWEEKKQTEFAQSLRDITLTVVFLLAPASLGFYLLRFEIIALIAMWGDFELEDAMITATVLGYFGLGVVSIGLKEVFDRGFYAKQNPKIPGIFGFVIMGINIVFSLSAINTLGFLTIPISFAVSTTIGTLGLMLMMHLRVGLINGALVGGVLKVILATGIMGIALWASQPFFEGISLTHDLLHRGVQLFAPTLFGVSVYFMCALLLGIGQIKGLAQMIRKK